MVRDYTNKLRNKLVNGELDGEFVLNEILQFFSEDQIKDFCLNGFGGEYSDIFEEDIQAEIDDPKATLKEEELAEIAILLKKNRCVK